MLITPLGELIAKTYAILPIEGMSPIFTSEDLGEIDVNLQLLTKLVEPPGENIEPPEVTIRTQVIPSNEYTTSWICDCLADFQITKPDNSSPVAEKFHITVGLGGLILDSLTITYTVNDPSETSNRLLESMMHQFQKKSKEIIPPGWDGTPPVVIEKIEYHIFQNQRRSMGLWGSNSLHADEFEFTDESGTVHCPFTPYDTGIDPPDGFSWEPDYVTEWKVDRSYTTTDEDGWSYGLDFGWIMTSYREGKSASSSAGVRTCRRRRWRRVAKRVTPMPVTSLDQTPSERDTKVLESLKGTEGFDEDDESPEIEDEVIESPQQVEELKLFEVYENQRIVVNWDSANLFSAERPPFSDETGEIRYNYTSINAKNEPPPGYEWVDLDWKVDTDYTNTDPEGWVYGIDFTWIMANLKKGRSTTSSMGRSVRRRKYIRRMRKVGKSITGLSGELPLNQSSEKRHEPKEIKTKLELFQAHNDLIMSLCQERDSIDSSVFIPWDQVISFDVITPTVLGIKVTIHRYFGEDPNKTEIYRATEMTIFVLDCPAEKLAKLIYDRQHLDECRYNISCLITSGTMTGLENSQYLYQTHTEVMGENNQIKLVPAELSLGSSTSLYLDKELIKLSHEIDALSKYKKIYLSTSNSPNSPMFPSTELLHAEIENERIHLCLKRVRLLVYVATLLESSLRGPEYDESSMKQMINFDYKAAERLYRFVGQEEHNEMDAARQMVNFLLETAEMRIRDTALCGWRHRGPLLERCLGILINGYFTQIIGVLGRFFESKEGLMTLKVHGYSILYSG